MTDEYTYQLRQFEAEAQVVLVAARTKAREILKIALAEAARQRDAARKEGFDKGFAEGGARGREEGLKRAAAETKTLAAAMDAAARALDEQKKIYARLAEKELVSLAVAIAERIVRAEIELDHKLVGRIVADAVALATSRHRLTLEIHPTDAKAVKAALPELKAAMADIEAVEIVENESITPGGCVVRTVTGEIDAKLETRLANLREAILGKK